MFQIGIVGSGPAAFYTAQKLLKSNKIKIDMFEKLPVPFGLIRYGVAPDHPEVKNVFKTFTQVALNERFRFFGNVNVGQDIRIKDMKDFYHGIVLAYGAAKVNKLNIIGEDLKQVYSAFDLVGWYNGLPEKEEFSPDLSGHESVIIGHGNVALDIARIFLTPIDVLRKTDIPDSVLSQLAESKIKKIHLVGRRGPIQAAFTIKEFRELLHLDDVRSHIHVRDDIYLRPEIIDLLPRPRKRMMNLIVETLKKQNSLNHHIRHDDSNQRSWEMHFLRSPLAICDNSSRPGNVDHIKLGINILEGDSIQSTNDTVEMPCQMVVSSIGYKGVQIDSDIPFDNQKNIVPNINGRVIEESVNQNFKSALYCVGWIKRGPTGVIVNTLSDAQETCSTILKDLEETTAVKVNNDIKDFFQDKNVKYLSFANWEAIDKIETTLGEMKGKPREKLTNIRDMMIAARIDDNVEK